MFKSQIFAERSWLTVTMAWRALKKATARTLSSWPPREFCSCKPSTRQILVVWSRPALASQAPSLEKARPLTPPGCAALARSSPVIASCRMMAPRKSPVTKVWPSGANAAARAPCFWRARLSSLPLSVSQILICPGIAPPARRHQALAVRRKRNRQDLLIDRRAQHNRRRQKRVRLHHAAGCRRLARQHMRRQAGAEQQENQRGKRQQDRRQPHRRQFAQRAVGESAPQAKERRHRRKAPRPPSLAPGPAAAGPMPTPASRRAPSGWRTA